VYEYARCNVRTALRQIVAKHLYLLINAPTYFGVNCWPFSRGLPADGEQLKREHVLAVINK
jgi:hypothetical protein